jgi:site-specific DNA-cytosine methylase
MLYENKVIHMCCGIGAAAYGMQQSIGEYKGAVGRFRTLVGIDNDPLAVQDFRMITGAPAVQMDLFSLQDYIDFHGCRPPEDWREVTPEDIFEAAGREYPDTGFISAPCKGLSGLLPAAMAKSKKYQALNNLTVRCVRLTLEAFEFDPIGIFLFENVPRIRTRGAKLLEEIRQLYKYHGYEVVAKQDEIHDCGELGGLGQHRNRFLLATRHPDKVPAFIYKPPKLPLKAIGDVIGPMLLPDDPAAGPMHRMPRLQWKTWVRLALIPAGGDWRDLQNINPEQYRIEHMPRGGGSFGVQDWDQPSGTVTGNMRPGGSTASAIPDPRMTLKCDSTHKAIYRVSQYDEPASTVTGAHRPNNGAIVIPDPRLQACEGKHPAYTG